MTLLRDALTHRSLANERPQVAPQHNERLEYLGDAVLQLAISDMLYRQFSDAREGELTRRRAQIVCEAGLTEAAEGLDLGPVLRLGIGEERSGGRSKPRLLSSGLEACFAAVYLDGGPEAALALAGRLFGPHIEAGEVATLDFKSQIQERVQADGGTAPTYHLVRTEGPDHERHFFVEIRIGGEPYGHGEGRTKTDAEQAAAEEALEAWAHRQDG
jgi:ribonuclease-3